MQEELLIAAKPTRRIVAIVLDLLINLAVDLVLLIPSVIAFVGVLYRGNYINIVALFISSLLSGALIISFAIFYFVCLPVVWEGQTIGKRALKIRIVDVNTNEGPSAKIMFLREATRILIFVLSVGMSGIVSLLALCLSDKHTTFHEQLSHTRVVNINIYPNLSSGIEGPNNI